MHAMPDRALARNAVGWPAMALCAAIVARVAMDAAMGDALPLITVFGAVAAAQWTGGWRSATAVAILGYAAAHYLFIAPRHNFHFEQPAVVIGAAAFTVTAALIVGFGEVARRAQNELHASQRALAERVRHLDDTVRALRETEAVFRTIGEAVPDFLWLADATGRPIYQNPAWTRYVGLDPDAFREVGWETLHPPEDVPVLTVAWQVALEHREPFSVDVRLRRRDGVFRWFHCRTVPLCDETGTIRKWVGTMTDIHDLKKAEQQLSDAGQRKDEFLALLSHELRNPLAPLRSAVDLLRLQEPSSPATAGLYDMMERQLAQLVRLVDDLLEISRISSGTLKLRREPVRVGDVIRSAIETTTPKLERAGHTLTTAFDHEGATVDGDPVRLAQILTNLLTNAIRYTPEGGRVHVGTRTTESTVAITVVDTGVGIPAGELPHIFEMFTRGRNAYLVRDGLGVGLALASKLADMHGGRIEANSGGERKGSTFTLYLPCTTLEASPSVRAFARPASRVTHRILVVDDNADAADSLGQLLQCLGAAVDVVHSGRDALDRFARVRPSLVLLDLGMPGMDGFETLDALRALPGGRDANIVALTGWGQDGDRLRVKEAGFDGHLVKPVELAALEVLLVPAEQHARA